MSSTILLPGASRVVKLTPNNSLIPSPISSIDNLFDISLLSGAKFASWRSLATEAGKIGIVENEGKESLRFIDTNFNISTPAGSLWFLGKSEQNLPYYLQTGASLSKVNSASVFNDIDYIIASGLLELSGVNFSNRCSDLDGHLIDVAYNQAALIDKGVGFDGSTSVISFNEEQIPLEYASKFSVKLVMKQTVMGVMSAWAVQGTAFMIFCQDANTLSFTTDQLYYMATMNPTGVITSDTMFILDIVYDGTLVGNNNRLKIYIDGIQQSLSFVGDVPANYGDLTGFSFDIGLSGLTFAGVVDEIRMKIGICETEEEIIAHSKQWHNKATFWTPTIQPVITTIENLGAGRWQLTGSGFIPESSDPTCEINGVACTIESASDTIVTIEEGIGTPSNNKFITLTNSDSETVNYLTNYPFTNIFGNSPFKFGF